MNTLLMITTIALVLGFRSSSRLAVAYGVAVTTTMLVTTILFHVVARERWRWRWWAAAIPAITFFTVDVSFLVANVAKVLHGGWFPLMIGAVTFTLMATWRRGRDVLERKLAADAETLQAFVGSLGEAAPIRVPGRAVYLSGNPTHVPSALLHNLRHNKVLHAEVAVVNVSTADTPRVPRAEKVEIEDLGKGVHRVHARFGFMEDPNVPYVLALAREKGLDVELEETSFFLGRERLLPARHPELPFWRNRLFAFMSRNAVSATTYFRIPPEQVIEVGAQIEI